MKLALFAATVAAWASNVAAVGVVGAAEGFAKGVTGGGSATPVYPKTNAELVSYLGDSSARVIVLQKTFDFTGTEGTTSGTGCAAWGTGSNCQLAINKDNWVRDLSYKWREKVLTDCSARTTNPTPRRPASTTTTLVFSASLLLPRRPSSARAAAV